MLVSLGENGLDPLFKEVRVFKDGHSDQTDHFGPFWSSTPSGSTAAIAY